MLQYGQLGMSLQTEKTETGLLDIQIFLEDLAENVGAFSFSVAKMMSVGVTEGTNINAYFMYSLIHIHFLNY